LPGFFMNLILRAGRRFNPKRRRANAEFPPPDRADALMLALCRPYQKFEFYSIRDLQHRSRSAGPDPRENPYWSFTELGDDDDGVDKRRSLGGLGREASIASRQGCELELLWIETPGAQDDAEPQEMLGVASARDLRSRMDPERLSGRYSPESSQSYPRPILLGPSARRRDEAEFMAGEM
jgi:hypothetical protein